MYRYYSLCSVWVFMMGVLLVISSCNFFSENFLEVTSILLITVLVNDESIGSRQLKCESSLDTVKTVLDSVSNTTEFMCQVSVHSFMIFHNIYYYCICFILKKWHFSVLVTETPYHTGNLTNYWGERYALILLNNCDINVCLLHCCDDKVD